MSDIEDNAETKEDQQFETFFPNNKRKRDVDLDNDVDDDDEEERKQRKQRKIYDEDEKKKIEDAQGSCTSPILKEGEEEKEFVNTEETTAEVWSENKLNSVLLQQQVSDELNEETTQNNGSIPKFYLKTIEHSIFKNVVHLCCTMANFSKTPYVLFTISKEGVSILSMVEGSSKCAIANLDRKDFSVYNIKKPNSDDEYDAFTIVLSVIELMQLKKMISSNTSYIAIQNDGDDIKISGQKNTKQGTTMSFHHIIPQVLCPNIPSLPFDENFAFEKHIHLSLEYLHDALSYEYDNIRIRLENRKLYIEALTDTNVDKVVQGCVFDFPSYENETPCKMTFLKEELKFIKQMDTLNSIVKMEFFVDDDAFPLVSFESTISPQTNDNNEGSYFKAYICKKFTNNEK